MYIEIPYTSAAFDMRRQRAGTLARLVPPSPVTSVRRRTRIPRCRPVYRSFDSAASRLAFAKRHVPPLRIHVRMSTFAYSGSCIHSHVFLAPVFVSFGGILLRVPATGSACRTYRSRGSVTVSRSRVWYSYHGAVSHPRGNKKQARYAEAYRAVTRVSGFGTGFPHRVCWSC